MTSVVTAPHVKIDYGVKRVTEKLTKLIFLLPWCLSRLRLEITPVLHRVMLEIQGKGKTCFSEKL